MTSRTDSIVPPQPASIPAERSHVPKASPIGVRVGRIASIEIRVDPSVLLVGALVALNLAAGPLRLWHPDWSGVLVWSVAIVASVLFFLSILAHELAHALVGRALGLPTERITLFIFGGMAELKREPDRPKVELLTAAAGPALSIAIGMAAALAGGLLGASELGGPPEPSNLDRLSPVSTLLLWLGPVNVMLGIFNLVPGFPLDGGRVLRALLWWRTRRLDVATRWATRAGQLVAGLLVFGGILMMFGVQIPLLGSGLASGIWLVLIGWFLNSAAVNSRSQSPTRPR